MAIMRTAGALTRVYQRSGLQGAVRTFGLTMFLPATLRQLEPQTPPMARAFSNRLISPHESPSGVTRYRVALLTGCIQDLVFSNVNRDTADVLLANGCAIHTPAEQPCCGSLHAHNGELELARQQARRMIDVFPPDRYDAIITNAGGCGSHLRRYGHLLESDPRYEEAARVWDTKVKDVQEWLVAIGCRTPEASPFAHHTTVTYHDSCHLVHGQQVSAQPRAILRLLPGVSLVELAESTWLVRRCRARRRHHDPAGPALRAPGAPAERSPLQCRPPQAPPCILPRSAASAGQPNSSDSYDLLIAGTLNRDCHV